jgi:hypothetical protein
LCYHYAIIPLSDKESNTRNGASTVTTTTQAPEIELLDYLTTADGAVGCLCRGKGYWIRDLVDHFAVSAEDGSGVYTVRLGARSKPISCTCPAKRYNPGKVCKHQKMAIELMKGW